MGPDGDAAQSQGDRPPVRREGTNRAAQRIHPVRGVHRVRDELRDRAALFYAKLKQKGEGDDNIDEDLPPITRVKK